MAPCGPQSPRRSTPSPTERGEDFSRRFSYRRGGYNAHRRGVSPGSEQVDFDGVAFPFAPGPDDALDLVEGWAATPSDENLIGFRVPKVEASFTAAPVFEVGEAAGMNNSAVVWEGFFQLGGEIDDGVFPGAFPHGLPQRSIAHWVKAPPPGSLSRAELVREGCVGERGVFEGPPRVRQIVDRAFGLAPNFPWADRAAPSCPENIAVGRSMFTVAVEQPQGPIAAL